MRCIQAKEFLAVSFHVPKPRQRQYALSLSAYHPMIVVIALGHFGVRNQVSSSKPDRSTDLAANSRRMQLTSNIV